MRRNFDLNKHLSLEEEAALIKKKLSANYINNGDQLYVGRGQWQEDAAIGDKLVVDYETLPKDSMCVDDIQRTELDYLFKIIDLCEEKNIELTFYIMPYTALHIMNFENYYETTDYIKEIASEKEIQVVDLNLAKPEYLEISYADFFNWDHVNSLFSYRLADFFYQYHDCSECFFASYDEKYAHNMGENYVIVYRKRTENGKLLVDVTLYGNEIKSTYATMLGENGNELFGKKLDKYTTQFELPPYGESYYVKMYDSFSDELVFEAQTDFGMG